jgi:hypothetical protein
MEDNFDTIESLRTRAEEFRVRAESCKTDRYIALMLKGAAHLDEEATLLETRLGAPRRN